MADTASFIIPRLEAVRELRIVQCRSFKLQSLSLLQQCCPLLRRLDLEVLAFGVCLCGLAWGVRMCFLQSDINRMVQDVGETTAALFPVLNGLHGLREVRFGGFTFENPTLLEVVFLNRLTSLEFFCCHFGRDFWRVIAFCTRQLRR
jgi:hypothetical protein